MKTVDFVMVCGRSGASHYEYSQEGATYTTVRVVTRGRHKGEALVVEERSDSMGIIYAVECKKCGQNAGSVEEFEGDDPDAADDDEEGEDD